MALQTNAATQYDQGVSLREDLEDVIFSNKEDGCIFTTSIAKNRVPVSQKLHEWQIDEFESIGNAPALEGRAFGLRAIADRTRLNNHCQINGWEFGVSGSQESAQKAGVPSEIARQVKHHTMSLKEAVEIACVGVNNAKVAGNNTTPRETASVQSWLYTNTQEGTGGADPTGDGSDARTDGAPAALTEAKFKAAMQSVFLTNRKQKSNLTVMLGAYNKGVFAGFTGRATDVNSSASDLTIFGDVEYYRTLWGLVRVYGSAHVRQRDMLIFDPDRWAIGTFRKMRVIDNVMVGQFDGVAKGVDMEWCLISRNESSSAGVFDLTTS